MRFARFSTKLVHKAILYANVSALAGSCESQVLNIWNEDMAAAADVAETARPVQVGFGYLILLYFISEGTFLKDIGLLMPFLSTWV